MIHTNTIPLKEYSERLYQASRSVKPALQKLMSEAELKSRLYENRGDEQNALKYLFIANVLSIARDSITKSPDEFLRMISKSKNNEKSISNLQQSSVRCNPSDDQ